ncbi:hypothetical protein Clacol_001319 [Clathrus columnatus]|uniref:Nuclear pore complex protein Nup205 n=1 Tax=Clathrus columnatus TaxID=1419009 RepID=A0AAV5A2Z1_9AGAM|nr:hypothetical protein Clacol_001319 [Clathrus columnatus]
MDEGLVALCNRINDGLLVQTTEHEEQGLYYELEKYKPLILRLFDVGLRSSQEAKNIENKKYIRNGKEHAIKDSKAQPILFVADQLDCSEYYCAALFAKAERKHPNYDLVQLTESAVELFYSERAFLIECLMNILQASTRSSIPSNSLRVILTNFATESVESAVDLGGGKQGRFPEKILVEIDHSIESSKKISNALLNATSMTTIGSSNTATLSHNILQMRLDCLRSERRQLGTLLFVIASTSFLAGGEVLKATRRLAEKPQEDVTYYILASTLKSLSFPIPTQKPGLHKDKSFVDAFSKLLNSKSEWKSHPLRGIILLQWSVLIWSIRHQDEELAEASSLPPGFSDEDVEKNVWDAVQSDVFQFLSNLTLTIRPQGSIDEADRSFASLRFGFNVEGDTNDQNINDEGFKLVLLEAFESLITDFIKSMSSVIRRIKHRQEDLILASSRTNRPVREDQPTQPPRNDVAQLFEFIGILYTCLPPDRGLHFWSTASEVADGKLFAFLRWATESRDQKLISAGYDMLAGIAKGRVSSEVAYNFLIASGTNERTRGGIFAGGGGSMFSWSMLFNALTWWAENLPNPHVQNPHLASSASGRWQQPVLSDAEAIMLSSFLRLLRVVVKHAPAARIALYTIPDFRVVTTLLALLQQGIQLELKGVILDTLAAFCEPGAGLQGIEICRTVWVALERAELINLRTGGGIATRGVENELEGVESPAQRYPATIPFLRLLSALIHTPKDLRPQQVLIDYEPIDTIPDGLGQPARFGGISPYVRFVIDSVLLRAKTREYHDPSDKWRMIESALCFIERCLANYNLDGLLLTDESTTSKNVDLLRSLQSHPAFDILIQLLTDSPLRREVMEYVQFGVEALESKSFKNVYFERVILRVLRIIQYVLDIQGVFTEMLLPSLVHFDSMTSDVNFLSSSIIPLDQCFNWTPALIIKIALCATYAELEESKLLSIKIIAQLSESPVFMATEQTGPGSRRKSSRLALIFERSEDALIIQDSFMVLLLRNASRENIPSNELVQLSTGAGAPISDISLYLTQAIQTAILDLMLRNTLSDKPAPNVVHSLLGFGVDSTHTNQLVLQDPQAANSRQTCLHAILELLNNGITRTPDGNTTHGVPTFLLSYPSLAERCYRLIHQLCEHRATSIVMMRYLRTREDFFPRQLTILPLIIPSEPQGATGEVTYPDGRRVKTTIEDLVSFFRVRAWILESTALEIHMLTEMGQTQRTAKLLSLLFGNSVPRGDHDSLIDNLLNPFSAGQSLLRIIELFQSLDIEWQDNLTTEQDFHLTLFAGLDVSSCLQVDETGCETFDVNALLGIMYQARRQIQSQGIVNTPQIHEQLRKEMNYILTSCAIENNRRRVQHVRSINYDSWKRLLDISLSKSFSHLSSDRRESVLFDLLELVLPTIPTVQPSTAISLSELTLTLVTKLRTDREQQLIFHSTFDNAHVSTLPTDRLRTLLKSLIACLGSSGKVRLIRGNLYASLINYLHLVQDSSDNLDSDNQLSSSRSDTETVGPFTLTKARSKRSDLENSVLSILNQDLDGIVSLISTDAIDGTEVWKTVSFTLLDSLICISRLEKQHRALNIISRKGFLQNFVQSIKDSDADLLQVLKPDPENLNALYVYEARMALLIRIAQTQAGAEKLLDCRILHILSQCEFIEARPEGDQSFLDYDSFLPSAVYRYHQLVLPALSLVNSLVATLGKSSRAPEQLLRFLLSHRETFLILIRENALKPSLQQVQELHLLVTTCSFVTPLVHASDLKSPASGFGGLHSAILALAARCLSTKRWHECQPANDTERVEASTKVFGKLEFGYATKFLVERQAGYGRNVSVFDLKLEDAVELFYEGLWTYLESVSDQHDNSAFTPVFTPIGVNTRPLETAHQITASAPTISDSIEALSRVVSDLTKVLNEVTDIASKLASREQLELEEADEISQLSEMKYTEEFSTMQRRLLAFNELRKSLTRRVNIAKRRSYSLEILLLLLWRHLDYYTKGVKPMDSTSNINQFTRSSARRSVLAEDALTSLIEHSRRTLRPILERLDTLSIPPTIMDNDHRSKEEYIRMMCRLIRNTTPEEKEAEMLPVDDVRSLGSW